MGAQSATEESLYESLVANRDSSVATLPQNDNGIESARNPSSNSLPPLCVPLRAKLFSFTRSYRPKDGDFASLKYAKTLRD
ncbi:hypothetical protein [Helicobacter marmotae]|uniref:hypothetical protein n=1 Tax=Helicobacter marmotae TaxID=152490 RepID=UPI0011C01748|nr:hypothetical protein [Helicobacter marmotae]